MKKLALLGVLLVLILSACQLGGITPEATSVDTYKSFILGGWTGGSATYTFNDDNTVDLLSMATLNVVSRSYSFTYIGSNTDVNNARLIIGDTIYSFSIINNNWIELFTSDGAGGTLTFDLYRGINFYPA